jgi:hypothetical protein
MGGIERFARVYLRVLVSERLNALKHGFLAGARSETLIGYDAQSSG